MAELNPDPVVTEVKDVRSDDLAALDRVLTDFKESENVRSPIEKEWDEYYALYRSKLRVGSKYPLISRSFIPLAHSFVETVTPFLVDSVFDDRQFILGIGQRPEDAKSADTIGKFVNWQMLFPVKYGSKLTDTIRAACIYGTAWQRTILRITYQPDFNPEVEKRVEAQAQGDALIGAPIDLLDQQPAEEPEESANPDTVKRGGATRRKIYEGPDVDYISNYDVYPDHAATEVTNMRYLIHREVVPMSRLKEMEYGPDGEKILKNLDKIPHTISENALTDVKSERLASQGPNGRGTLSQDSHETDREDRLVEVLNFWTPTWMIKIANRKAVLYNDANPYRRIPFTCFRPLKDPDFLYGMGYIELMRSIQKTANVMLNQHLDNVNLVLNPMAKVRRGTGIGTKTIAHRPGGIIHVQNPDDITPYVQPDITGSALNNIGNMINYAEMVTGVNDFFRGEEPKFSRTPASGISLLQKASGRRFSVPVRSLQDSIQDVVGQIHTINSDFTLATPYARYMGLDKVEYPRVDRHMLESTFLDFRPIGKASNGNPDVLVQIMKELDAAWAERPELGTDGRRQLMLTILDKLGIPNMVQIIPNTPPVPPGTPPGGIPGLVGPPPGGQGPPSIEELLAQVRGGGQAAPGAPLEVISQPPSPTNPGGARTINFQ